MMKMRLTVARPKDEFMSQLQRAIRWIVENRSHATLFLALFLILPGCGSDGGTSGSGGGRFEISGVLRTSGQAPLAGVRVDVAQIANSLVRVSLSDAPPSRSEQPGDVTDEQGQFFLSLDSRPQQITLQFTGESFDSTYLISNIPGMAATVNLELILNGETEELEEQSEQFEDDEGAELHERAEAESS